jgi:phosphoribosylanthranilate isomerase
VKIKICGITNIEDAELAVQLGADYLGFLFAPSPRQVSPGDVFAILEDLSKKNLRDAVKAVGVFVNERKEIIEKVIQHTGIDLVQLHGDEDVQTANSYSFPWYKALRIVSKDDVDKQIQPGHQSWSCSRLLVDTRVEGMYGGTGKTIALDVARYARKKVKNAGKAFFLAGGITPDNVYRLVAEVKPDGIDVSSGIEEKKGKKSKEKMVRLFAEIGTQRLNKNFCENQG